MTNHRFDLFIIGSGPAAIATIEALPRGVSFGVSTGDGSALSIAECRKAHSKIRFVAKSRNEAIGIRSQLKFENGGLLCNTAVIGGLANYWGQQFVNYDLNDDWPRKFFATYQQYLESVQKIESLFSFSQEFDVPSTFSNNIYQGRSPRLLIGSKADPHSGLLAMKNVFHTLVESKKGTIFNRVVKKWEVIGSGK